MMLSMLRFCCAIKYRMLMRRPKDCRTYFNTVYFTAGAITAEVEEVD